MTTELDFLLQKDEITEQEVEKLLAQNTPNKNEQVKALIKVGISSGRLKVSRRVRVPISSAECTRAFDRGYSVPSIPDKLYFDPRIVIEWAVNKKIELLPEIIEWHEQRKKPTPEANLPPYLDTLHSLHSPELAIAVEAWTAVLHANPGRPKTGTRKQLLIRWLQANHNELKKEAIERIACLLNPDKNGGAPKSELNLPGRNATDGKP